MARDVMTMDVRQHMATTAGLVEGAIRDHMDSEGIDVDSPAGRSFIETERDRFHQHLLDAAAEFELEDIEDFIDGQDPAADFERELSL